MTIVYLDANVLVPSYTRTLLIMSAPLANFTVVWSHFAETEAVRHQDAGATPITMLRQRFGWNCLVPDGTVTLDDTDPKDQPILSSAILAGAKLVVTENVKDFGAKDLERHQMSAVHPDLFLSKRLTMAMYQDVLGRLASARTRIPNTAEEIHRSETGQRLPLLAQAMEGAYNVNCLPPTKGMPRLTFTGTQCVVCEQNLHGEARGLGGVCFNCVDS